jgi:amidase
MKNNTLLNNPRLSVSSNPPYDALQAFVRDNHIALEGSKEGSLKDYVFAAKDVFMIKGSTVGNGHPDWLSTHGPDPFTSSAITTLLDVGADLVGKTICDELCYSISGENWHYGSPINPHDVRRFTGGSSSGSGAATAGGLVDFALGSDCLGSVRMPASYNGLLGMRPTYQRIANDGEAPYCISMDVLGYVANDPDVFTEVSKVLLKEDQEKTTFKSLYVATDCFDTVDADVKEALLPAVEFIKTQLDNTKDVVVAPEGLASWIDTFKHVQGYEVWESYGGFVNQYSPRLSRGPKERLEWASTVTLSQYRKGLKEKKIIEDNFATFLPKDSILVLPTGANIAPLRTASLDNINHERFQSSSLLCISPLTGTPQITVPLIKHHDVPLGLTLIGAKGTDMELVRFAAKLVKAFKQ